MIVTVALWNSDLNDHDMFRAFSLYFVQNFGDEQVYYNWTKCVDLYGREALNYAFGTDNFYEYCPNMTL